jgi:hypothetical protein
VNRDYEFEERNRFPSVTYTSSSSNGSEAEEKEEDFVI